MSPRARAIVFIGHYKVGSTSLQAYLARNAQALAKAGVLYPATTQRSLAAYTDTEGPVRLSQFDVLAPHNALAYRMLVDGGFMERMPRRFSDAPGLAEMEAMIDAQIADHAPHTLVLCAEIFGRFARHDPALVAHLRDRLSRWDITWLCTLRRPDDYLISWHNHRLRLNDTITPLRSGAIRDYAGTIHLDYRKFLTPWLDLFGKTGMRLASYETVRAAGGSVEDFVTRAGLPLPAGLVVPRNRNQGLHRAVVEIARRGNQALPATEAKELRSFLEIATAYIDVPPSAEIEMIGARHRRWLLRQFRETADWLTTLTGGYPFFGDIEEMLQTAPIAEIDAASAALDQIRRLEILDGASPALRGFLRDLRIRRPALLGAWR